MKFICTRIDKNSINSRWCQMKNFIYYYFKTAGQVSHNNSYICEMRNSDKDCCSECFWHFVRMKLLCALRTTEHIYKWFKFVNISYGMDADVDPYVGHAVTQGHALYDARCTNNFNYIVPFSSFICAEPTRIQVIFIFSTFTI